MPQSVDEFMAGRRKSTVGPKAEPTQALSVDEFMKQRKAKPAAPSPTPTPTPAPQGPGLRENVSIGAERGYYGGVEEPATSLYDTISAATRGDFDPLYRMGRSIAGGVYNLGRRGSPARPEVSSQTGERAGSVDAGVRLQTEELQRKREQERLATPRGREIQARRQQLDRRAALDPSISGKVTRGIAQGLTAAAPSVAAGIASGGSVPVMATMAALQSAAEPETMGLNVGLSAVPVPTGKVVAPLLRRLPRLRGVTEAVPPTSLPAVRQGAGGTEIINIAGRSPVRSQVAPETLAVPGRLAPEPIAQPSAPPLSTDEFLDLVKRRTGKEITEQTGGYTIKPEELGLKRVEFPEHIPDTQPIKALVPIDQIEIAQDFLYPHKLAKAARELSRKIRIDDTSPIQVVEDLRTGRLVVEDGSSRIGFLKLSGYKGDVPLEATVSAEKAAQLAQTPFRKAVRRVEPGLPKPITEPLELSYEPPRPIKISLGRERPRTPGAVGPRVDDNIMEFLSRPQPSPAPPPVPPPPINGNLWPRPPQQQPLLDVSPNSPWQDSVLGYYRANLLTNPVGRALDLGSTTINQFADAVARPVAAAADVIVSKLTGKRSITGPSLSGSGRAFGSVRQGLRDAREVWRTGQQAIDSGADDVLYGSEIRSGLGKGFDVPVNGVFRVLGALDAPFRRFGFERNLADRARVAAINESRRGLIPRNQIPARTAQLMDRDDIIVGAVRDGERAVLSEPNRISSWLSRQTQSSPNARLAIGIVQPFMRIPLNAILRSADFSGVGGIKAMYKIARGVGRRAKGQSFFRDIEEQRVFAMNVAAGSFAPAAFLLGMELEERGQLEGYYYTSRRDFPSGRVPTSIELGGTRYDINRLGGFIAAPLFIGATYNRLRREGSDQANSLLRSFSGLAQQAPALGYYGAPAKVGRILTADEPGEEIIKEAGSITSGFIPASGAMGATAKALDSNRQRETEGFTGQIMNRVPGLRSQLPEKQKGVIQSSGGYADKLKEHKIEPDSVKPMKGEPENLFKARQARIQAWSEKYGKALVGHSSFNKLTPDQQKAAIKSLREKIHTESNDREPNLSLFEAEKIIEAVKDSARRKTEQNRRKFYVEK